MNYILKGVPAPFRHAGIFVCLLLTCLRSSAQLDQLSEIVTVQLRNADALSVIQSLQKQSHYSFVYTASQLKIIPAGDISFDHIPLGKALEILEHNAGLDCKVSDGHISIRTVTNGIVIQLMGHVTDAKTHEPLDGVGVTVTGTRTAALSDGDGRFALIIGDTTVHLHFSRVGYVPQSVVVGHRRQFDISLVRSSKELEAVTVNASRHVNTESALLNERRKSAIVSDGISAQKIERTASITTTQALQQVTGVTITDEKYVAIRGLGDRSVIAELNGVRLSSANPDRSAVPLDLVPATLLDNITVYKTASPDHPADASAGIVELKTKSVPAALTVQFMAQTGTNTTVGLGGSVNSFQDADMGFWGGKIKDKDLSPAFLNLKNEYPGGLQQIQRLFIDSRTNPALAAQAGQINSVMQSFDPVLTTSYRKALPNQIYTVSLGNTFHIFGDHALGVILSANYYRRTEDRYQAVLNQYSLYQGVVTGGFTSAVSNIGQTLYTPNIYSPMHIPATISADNPRLSKYLGYSENSGTETVSYGGLAGLTYQFNAANEIQLQYIGSRGGETSGSNLNGAYDNTGLQFPVYDQVNQLRQTYRTFNTFNLQGEDRLKFGSGLAWPQLSYNLSSSQSRQDEPDFRFTDLADENTSIDVNSTGVGIGSNIYSFVVGSVHGIGPNGVIGADPNGRKYRDLNETNYNAKADLSEKVNIGGLGQTFKVGVNYLHRQRDFTESILGLPGTNAGGDDGLLQQVNGNLNELVSYSNIGLQNPANYDNLGQPRVGGFLYQIKKSPNNYTGTFETRAFYGMADVYLRSNLRLTGGVRFETTDIETTVDTAGVYDPLTQINGGGASTETVSSGAVTNPHVVYSHNYAPYYSANLTYIFRQNMNFRLAYNTSLARPEIRELTNIYEFDPFQFAVVVGNPNLVNQLTRSEDFRWEWFPRQDEVISASFFAKQIDHQLTKVFIYNAPGNQALYPEYPIVEFQNDPNEGYIYGIELEVRKELGSIVPSLKHLVAGFNFMGAYSEIVKNPARLDAAWINDRHAPAKSPVFEQPPYSINAYLDYDFPKLGTQATVSFNVVGERLVQVQMDGTPDIYDRPAPQLNFVFSQKLGKRFVVKGFAKNILNPAFREVYAYPGYGGKFYGQTYIHHQYYKGAELALGLTYNLF
jgi:TonB-dependent receptor